MRKQNIPDFLEALATYTEDIQGYYNNINANIPAWSTFADIFKRQLCWSYFTDPKYFNRLKVYYNNQNEKNIHIRFFINLQDKFKLCPFVRKIKNKIESKDDNTFSY